jgi:hypothetical protein
MRMNLISSDHRQPLTMNRSSSLRTSAACAYTEYLESQISSMKFEDR